jgi:hypothetical protein
MPEGWTEVDVEGERHEANFVKVAVNVVRRRGNPRNELPTILRRWFGADVGLPGTNFHVAFRRTDEGWTLAPAGRRPEQGLVLWESYSREQIPKLFGMRSSPQWQQSGFIFDENANTMVLLVTLEKSTHPEEHRYEDRFLSPDTFQWQSQNKTPQKGKVGQAIREHRKQGIQVHLFVRKTGKIDQRAAPFTYCGELDFMSWEGEKPITVVWQLRNRLPEALARQLGVSKERPA